MKKYTIVAIALVAIIIIAVLASSSKSNNQAAVKGPNTSIITVVEERFDFGEIDIFGGKVQTTYVLKNEGPDDVLITDAQTSCMCTEGEIDGYTFGMHGSNVNNVVIPVGAQKEVTAVFDPLAHGPNGTGKITRELMLKTNSTESPEVRLVFTGDVVKKETN